MPRHKDLKRLIRGRMKKTGESYTTARGQIISKSKPKEPPTLRADLSALAGVADQQITAKSGRNWQQWVDLLDAHKATAMKHGEIAALVNEKYGVGNWWSQAVTVGYERIKGLREIGQRLDGTYEANRSRTFNVPVTALFRAWADNAARRRWLNGVRIVVRTANPSKSIRLQWPDGTLVVAGFISKGAAKSAVAVMHTKLRDRAASDSAKKFWTERLGALGEILEKRGRRF